jgi:two-component system phosphate regulon response regulator PhoB
MSVSAGTILLIEPDSQVADQVKAQLASAGYKVVWSRGAQAAIHAVDQKTPQLIIMELVLANHGGIEFLYEFRSYAEWRTVPVIIFSRLQRREAGLTDQALAELGVTEYLYKPETSLQRLLQRVQASLTAGRPA